MGEWITIKQAAALLGLSTYRTWVLLRQGRLGECKKIGSVWVVRESEVRTYPNNTGGKQQ